MGQQQRYSPIVLAVSLCTLSQGFLVSEERNYWRLPTNIRTSSLFSSTSVNNDNGEFSLSSAMPSFNPLDRRSFVNTAAVSAAAVVTSTIGSPTMAQAKIRSTDSIIPEWTLERGVKMPVLALNTVGLSVEDTERAVRLACDAGFSHIDFHPGKERDGVAKYIANGGKRDNLFLNTKIRKAPPGTTPEAAAQRTNDQIEEDLRSLQVEQVDMLMLRDSPDCDVIQAQWAVLEKALEQGQTRSIGVINFCQSALTCLLETATVVPAVNYYMLHVGMGPDAHGLRTFGESRGIRTFAYGAIGEPGPNDELLSSPVLTKIGKARQKLPEEVALRWVLQTGAAVSVRPTKEFGLGFGSCSADDNMSGATCSYGIQSRAQSFAWKLSKSEMAQLDAMTSPDDNPTLFSSSGCLGSFVMPPSPKVT